MKRLTGAQAWYGTAETCPDLQYLSGFAAVDPALLVAHRKRAVLIVPAMEVSRANRAARSARMRVYVHSPAGIVPADRARASRPEDWIIAAMNKLGAREVAVPADFPVGIALALRRKGVKMTVADAGLVPSRRTKTPAEVRKIAEVQRATAAAMCAAVKTIAASESGPGGKLRYAGRPLTAEAIKQTIERELATRRCQASRTIVACGNQAADPHETGHGPLRAGQAIVIDIFPRHRESGYWGDMTRTVARGPVAGKLKQLYAAVLAAQRAALAMVKAGAAVRSIHRAAARIMEQHGWPTEIRNNRRVGFIHGTGHGVGLEIHEAPSLRDAPGRLRAGDVITIEPGLYYPGLGGVRIEDTVLVTREGYKMLASCPKRFEV